MTGQDIEGLVRLQQTRHNLDRIHPIIEYKDTGIRFESKTAVEEVGEFHQNVFG